LRERCDVLQAAPSATQLNFVTAISKNLLKTKKPELLIQASAFFEVGFSQFMVCHHHLHIMPKPCLYHPFGVDVG
jgi:hypothetical protein